jgi:arylsulfatase A-like enzyme
MCEALYVPLVEAGLLRDLALGSVPRIGRHTSERSESIMENARGFTGRIGRTVNDSEPSWPSAPRPRAGAPNVVLIVLDDVGFSQIGCYGSDIATPSLDALAGRGLRYSNFHVTSLCSPTRVCLLTGRNHHSVGMSRIAEMDNGYPNTRGYAAREAANLAELLRPLGKWHLVSANATSPAGPYDHWPLQRGFDRFYGFLGGETNQWNPELVLGNERVEAPDRAGYHLSEDLVDRAVLWLRQLQSASADAPFFLYLAFGAAHAPHHAPRSFIEKYRGRFDDGWDAARARVLARQQASGLLAKDQRLAPRNPGVAAWDELDPTARRVFARMQEVFAGFLDHTDVQIGRLTAELDRLGRREDTLVIALSDNGASQEGGPNGTYDEMRFFSGLPTSVDQNVPRLDDFGSPLAYSHYPIGWAMAGNTPFKRYKQNTHSGGIRAPLVLSWPRGIAARGETRAQFHHAIDVVPTVLELIGTEVPERVNGVAQMPLHGASFAYTFADPAAATRKETQYFEMFGHRGIWSRGWKAVTFHVPGADYDAEKWELYHLDVDPAEIDDLAPAEPEKLREMVDLWWREAESYGVLPLDDGTGPGGLGWRGGVKPKQRFVLHQGAVLPTTISPIVRGRSHRITARVQRARVDEGGVLVAAGGRFGGWSLYVRGNRLHYAGNWFGERVRVSSATAIPAGDATLRADVLRVGKDEALIRLFVDDAPAGEGRIAPFRPAIFANEPLEVGRDGMTPVDETYASPFEFGGRIAELVIELFGREVLDPAAVLDELLRTQ